MNRFSLFSTATLGLVLGVTSPGLRAQEAAAAEAAAPAEDHTADLKALDFDLARFDGLIRQYPGKVSKGTLMSYYQELSRRADRLRDKFDALKYDDLRYDINLQCQRLARAMAPLDTPPRAKGEAHRVAVHLLSPSPSNPADVTAALAVLEHEIYSLEAHAAKLPAGSAEQKAELEKIQRVKNGRAALAEKFTKAKWETTVADLRP